MNKQEAAEFLGVSVRALERYVQQGRISVKYEKGKTRSTANFDFSELEALRDELNQPTIKPVVESRQTATSPQPESDKPVLYAGALTEFDDITVIDKLSSIIEALLAKALSRDPSNFRQDGLKSLILSGFENLLHWGQKSRVW